MNPSHGGPSERQHAAESRVYLTAAGFRRLQDRLEADRAERRRLTPVDPNEVRDSADESSRLEAADEMVQLDQRIAATQSILARALPLPAGPDDGVIRLGSSVRVCDDRGESLDLTLVDPVEFDESTDSVAVDAPVGAALVGHRVGNRVPVSTPEGERLLEIVEVRAYHPG